MNSTLKKVGKTRLLRNFKELVARDRINTAEMIEHIGEIDRRKLYLEHAYPSMFAFCTRHFGMSEACAAKRIRAGRAACSFPRVLNMIRRGELHLSGLHLLSAHLTKENEKTILQRARHRSSREIEELVAEIAPKPDGHSIVRALPSDPEAELAVLGTTGRTSDAGSAAEDVGERTPETLEPRVPSNNLRNLTVPLSPRRYRLHVTIGQDAREALDELQGLLSHQIPSGDPALIVEKALQALLAETRKKRAAATDKPRKKAAPTSIPKKKDDKRSRTIPAAVRREVFKRDEGRCAFTDGEGHRCGSTWQLEFHHLVPFAREGPHTAKNVELRCRAHNQFEADLEYGRSFMEARRASREE